MRKTRWTVVLVVAASALLGLGCAGDVAQQVMGDPAMQGKIMDMISANQEAAGGMVDRLLGADSTRAMMIEKLVSSAGGAQAVMEAVAKNPTMIDGAINIAVQDPAMREHVLTLVKGINMAAR
jgi:hypothetical protein